MAKKSWFQKNFIEPLFGSSPQMKKYPNFGPQQLKYLLNALQQSSDMLPGLKQGPGIGNVGQMAQDVFAGRQNPALGGLPNLDFGGIENRYRDLFHSQTVPSIAERFTSMGGNDRLGSSAFTNAVGMAGADLNSQLAALRGQFDLQKYGAIGGLGYNLSNLALQKYGQQAGVASNLGQIGLQPMYNQVMFPGTQGLLGAAAGGLGQAAGMAGGMAGMNYLGNRFNWGGQQ